MECKRTGPKYRSGEKSCCKVYAKVTEKEMAKIRKDARGFKSLAEYIRSKLL